MVRAFLILTFLAALFMPLIIAALYKLPRQGAIAVLSLVFFWTGVGWVAAFFIAIGVVLTLGAVVLAVVLFITNFPRGLTVLACAVTVYQ